MNIEEAEEYREETVRCRCIICKKDYYFSVPVEGYCRWKNGELIQRAMPTLSVGDRELLISKTCSQCFDKLFQNEEDDSE